jgi:ribosomal protein S6--L-glutamate ligase
MSAPKILVLGSDQGWHADQLRSAAGVCGCELAFALYESLSASVGDDCRLRCSAGTLDRFDIVLTRTMPPGSLEQITFRLAMLHSHAQLGQPIVNQPRGLEIAIDKFATLARVASLGFDVPETRVVQTRSEAIESFDELGGDCVVKPIFGGEGKGVMRIRDRQLAWYTFATLDQLDAVFYVQRFVPPGGIDTRLLVIGDQVFGLRRENETDFRTNVSGGGTVRRIEPTQAQRDMARQITESIGLSFASVDIIDAADGRPRVLEVNAIPGWRGAQSVIDQNIGRQIVAMLLSASRAREELA